jgi:hypothetical protein
MAEEIELSSLSFPTDPSKLPTSKQIPIGDWLGTIKGFKGIKSGEPSDADRANGKVGGKVAIEMQIAVTEPSALKGILGRKTFWIGTDADPNATQKSTWERNATDLMAAIKYCGVGMSTSTTPEEAMKAAVGQVVGIHSYMKAAQVDKRDPSKVYPERPEIGSFWKPGTREVRVLDDSKVEQGDAVAVAPSSAGLSNSD